MRSMMAYAAAALVALWGVAHAIPTRAIVGGFEPTTTDNRKVILQEWVAEAFTMWGTAAMVVVTTVLGEGGSSVTTWVYRVAAGLLVALGTLTALTGARTQVMWFKICPVLMGLAAAMLLVASLS